MRRIATLVATGAVAAAAAVGLAASPATADTSAAILKGSAASTGAADFSVALTHHSWTSHGKSGVVGWGWYTHTSTKTRIYGYVRDTRSGSYYGGVYIKFWDAGYKHWDYEILYNRHHGTTAKFPAVYYSTKHSHLQIAEVLVKKSGSSWKLSSVGRFYTIF